MRSCLYEGWVGHRRLQPAGNEFRYRVFHVYLDLSESDEVFRGRWLWSTRGPSLAWFRRSDHLGDPSLPLEVAVRNLVEERTGTRPSGPIRLLTHLRYFGYVMNPVSFYYCFDASGVRVETIVAELHNTPWGEQHCYVLAVPPNQAMQFEFPKEFHVSPFMGMVQTYRWRFSEPGDSLSVQMENIESGVSIFDATMKLERTPITGPALARVLTAYPWMTAKVIGAIYWQALKLWWKRCPFYTHPKRGIAEGAR